MNIDEIKQMPLWQMTGEEFLFLQRNINNEDFHSSAKSETSRRYVFGIFGISKILGCSMVTAFDIKQSGKIDKAITEIGKIIVIDAQLAIELLG